MMPFSDEDLKFPVNNLIKTKIAPMLASDGGDIILLDIIDGNIFVQLKGACIGCSASSSTLKFIVEKELKAHIHPDVNIINVPENMEHNLKDLL